MYLHPVGGFEGRPV